MRSIITRAGIPIAGQIVAGGSGPGEVPIYTAPAGQTVTDLAMGYDGVLYVAVGGSLVLIDRQDRWANFTLTVPGFNFWRLVALADGGVLALDRTARQLGKVTGTPLQTGPMDSPAPGILRSCQTNPNPPSLVATWPIPSTDTYVALTAIGKRVALVSWDTLSANNKASYRAPIRLRHGRGRATGQLERHSLAVSLAWLGDLKLAVLATGLNEALVFNLAETGRTLVPAGDTYVLAGLNSGPFAHVLSQPPYYTAGVNLGAPQTVNSGTATLPIASLAAGTHAIRAVYSGDGKNAANTSAVLVETVAATGAPVLLSSSANPSAAGQSVTFTATVTPATATGSVQFLDGGAPLGTAPISGGVARLTSTTLAAGTHSITATYSGRRATTLVRDRGAERFAA